MSKELYEEALADLKKLTQVAEDNAKKVVLEAVTPRIKKLIEEQLMNENFDTEDMLFDDEDLSTNLPLPLSPSIEDVSADAISAPDEEGKVTLDVDALDSCDSEPVAPPVFGAPNIPEEEYKLGLESLVALAPLATGNKFDRVFNALSESVDGLKGFGEKIRKTSRFNEQVTNTISRVENMYDYVQERVTDAQKKKLFESKLETLYRELQELQMPKRKLRLNEEDELNMGSDDDTDGTSQGELTLKLSGLPDDVDLDGVGVDLISGEDDVDGDDDIELVDDEGESDFEDSDGDEDFDLDVDSDEDVQTEVSELSDNTVVEIDESVLRREISRMRKLRESEGVDNSVLDDFGGGDDEGEAFLDGDVTTESEEIPATTVEGLKKRVAFERKIQENAKARALAAKRKISQTRGSNKSRIVKEYKEQAKRFNASLARMNKLNKTISEARSNSASAARGALADNKLRKQLAESNLINTKLLYANKVLQNESMSKRQKAQLIKRLDETKTPREVKLVFDSMSEQAAPVRQNLREGRETRVLGSASRAARPSSTTVVNEGVETARWAQLAGLK